MYAPYLICYFDIIDLSIHHTLATSARIFATMPASESSVNPIWISYVSKKLRDSRAPGDVEILLRVNAANWLNFYWFLMCWSIPIKIPSSLIFLENSILASGLTSDIDANISIICYFTSVETSKLLNTWMNTSTLSLIPEIIPSSLSSTRLLRS